MKTSELKSQTKFETEFFLKFYEKKKCENYQRWSIQSLCKISDSLDSHHLRKEGKWTESNQGTILFPRPVPRRIGTAEAPSKNFRQVYYQLGLSCRLLMNPLQSHPQVLSPSSSITSRLRERGNLGEHLLLYDISFVIYKID